MPTKRELNKKEMEIFRVPMEFINHGKTKKEVEQEKFRRKLRGLNGLGTIQRTNNKRTK